MQIKQRKWKQSELEILFKRQKQQQKFNDNCNERKKTLINLVVCALLCFFFFFKYNHTEHVCFALTHFEHTEKWHLCIHSSIRVCTKIKRYRTAMSYSDANFHAYSFHFKLIWNDCTKRVLCIPKIFVSFLVCLISWEDVYVRTSCWNIE